MKKYIYILIFLFQFIYYNEKNDENILLFKNKISRKLSTYDMKN